MNPAILSNVRWDDKMVDYWFLMVADKIPKIRDNKVSDMNPAILSNVRWDDKMVDYWFLMVADKIPKIRDNKVSK